VRFASRVGVQLSLIPSAGVFKVAVIVPSPPPLQLTGVVFKLNPVIGVAGCNVTVVDTSQPVVYHA
jgi:hypothetical protein